MRNTRLLINIALLLGLLAAAPAAVMAAPETVVRDSIPDQYKWDLSVIYSGWEAWDRDYARAESLIDSLAGFEGTINSAERLLAAFRLRDEIGLINDKIYVYANLGYDIDMRDNESAARYRRYGHLTTIFGQASSWFRPELLAVEWSRINAWLEELPELEIYRFFLEDLNRRRAHFLDAAQEKLLSYFGSFNSSPDAIYADMVYSDIQYPDYVTAAGDTLTLSEGQVWYQMQANRDQAERQAMFREFYRAYDGYVNTYASMYNSVLQRDWALAQARNYPTCLEAALGDDNIPVAVYENLIETVRHGTAPLKRYHQVRKEALGLEHYYWSDRKVPLVDFDKTYEYDAVIPWMYEAMAPLGDEYLAKLRQLLGGRWIDVYSNEGKYTGGYELDAYGMHPFILLNHNGTLSEVFTIAHEAGHALHSVYSNENQPYATAYYTIFVAEVPSTLNEALLLDYLLDRSDDPAEKITMLQQAIENIAGTFYLQTLFADFEWQAHAMVEQGEPITADALRAIYDRLLTDYFGEAIEGDSLYQSYWTRIGHFFESPYYVYKYATSFASSAKMVQGITAEAGADRDEALEQYYDLIQAGGNDYPVAQLAKAGVDLTSPEVLQAVVDQLDRLVTRLEEELAQIQ